jgi:hypothetical protein
MGAHVERLITRAHRQMLFTFTCYWMQGFRGSNHVPASVYSSRVCCSTSEPVACKSHECSNRCCMLMMRQYL